MLTELDGLSLRTVARELERRGIATMRGGKWTPALCRPRENAYRRRLALMICRLRWRRGMLGHDDLRPG